MSDTPENVDYRTVLQALAVTEAVARELAAEPRSAVNLMVRSHRSKIARIRALAPSSSFPPSTTPDPALQGDPIAMPCPLRGHDGSLAIRTSDSPSRPRVRRIYSCAAKDAMFPGLTIAELFAIADGALYEKMVENIIDIDGDDHRRLETS